MAHMRRSTGKWTLGVLPQLVFVDSGGTFILSAKSRTLGKLQNIELSNLVPNAHGTHMISLARHKHIADVYASFFLVQIHQRLLHTRAAVQMLRCRTYTPRHCQLVRATSSPKIHPSASTLLFVFSVINHADHHQQHFGMPIPAPNHDR